MAIVLKPEQERFIQSQIDAGQFSNAEQVIDTAFRLLEQHSAEYAQWVNEVREKGFKNLIANAKISSNFRIWDGVIVTLCRCYEECRLMATLFFIKLRKKL
jgi:putative addiction module CopG family antidote